MNKYKSTKKIQQKKLYLYPWHFFKRQLKYQNNTWKFDFDADAANQTYRDDINKAYSFPPPLNNIDTFVSQELLQHVHPQDKWALENNSSKMPNWMLTKLV